MEFLVVYSPESLRRERSNSRIEQLRPLAIAHLSGGLLKNPSSHGCLFSVFQRARLSDSPGPLKFQWLAVAFKLQGLSAGSLNSKP
jgi:hypothetical protein